jgi:hypothetical protein
MEDERKRGEWKAVYGGIAVRMRTARLTAIRSWMTPTRYGAYEFGDARRGR